MLVRSLFNAHDIPVIISGEPFFALYPWYLGAFRTDVFVSAADAEDAAALLADSRSGGRTVLDNFEGPEPAIENRDHADLRLVGTPPHPWSIAATDRWHQAGMTLLFGILIGFGAAHSYYTRAWVRGLVLAVIQLSVIKLFGYSMNALAMTTSARLADTVGALWLTRDRRDEPAAPSR